MDYRELLLKFLIYLNEREGSDFVEEGDKLFAYGAEEIFSEDETACLARLSKIAAKRLNGKI